MTGKNAGSCARVRPFGLWVTLVLAASAGSSRAQTTTTAPPEVTIMEAVTVTVWNRPLVVLRASIGEVTPSQRAAHIRDSIEALPVEASNEVTASHAAIGGLEGMLVNVDKRPVLGILPQDLDPESTETIDEVAGAAALRLQEILQARRESQQFNLILRRAARVVGATALLVLIVVLLTRFRRRTLRLVSKWFERPLALRGFDIGAFLVRIIDTAINLVVLFLLLAAIQSWLAFSLKQFPYTRPWGDGLSSYLLGLAGNLSLGVVRTIPGLFTAAVIFVVARFVSRVVGSFFHRVGTGEIEVAWLEADTARATRRIATALIWIFAIIAAYPYLPGAQTDAFKGVSVFVGLMVSLGGVSFVNQIMSGLVVVYARTFRIGDYVRVGDNEGIVTEIGTLSTKITTRTGEEITVPNAVLVGTTVMNYTRLAGEDGGVVKASVSIGYDVPWRQVHAMLELAAGRTSGVRTEPKPTVLQRSLSDFYVEYQLLAHIERVEDRIRVLSDLNANIQDAFNEHEVQIMSPHFRDQPEEKVFVPKESWTLPPAAGGATAPSEPGDSLLPKAARSGE